MFKYLWLTLVLVSLTSIGCSDKQSRRPAIINPAPAPAPVDVKKVTITEPGSKTALAEQPVSRTVKSIDEPVPNRGVFGGWAVDTFPLSKTEMKTMAEVYDTYADTHGDFGKYRSKRIANMLRILASEPNDIDLERMFYDTVINAPKDHPLRTLLLNKCDWHYVQHVEGSEGYADFQESVRYATTAYGLE